MSVLRIRIRENCPNKEFVLDYYNNKIESTSYLNDCGVDLVCPAEVIVSTNQVTKIGLGIECEFVPEDPTNSKGYMLVPRSSISATPLSLANSIGIIDPGYRGEIIAAVRCHIDRAHESTLNNSNYMVKKGDRLFQIISYDGKPIKIQLTETLSQSDRGANGFGSTNK